MVSHRQIQDDGEETKMLSEHKLAAQAPFPAPALGEPYLLTPGPLTTSYAVKQAMLRDSIIGNDAVVRGTFTRINAGASSELELGL